MLDQRLEKYLNDNYYDEIYNSIKVTLKSEETLDDFEITNLSLYDNLNLDFYCEIKVDAYINNEEYSNVNQKPFRYIVSFNGCFSNNKIECIKFKAKYNDDSFKKEDNYMDNSFLPHINKDTYEKIANIFLEEYFPEYKTKQAIDINTILKRLNLRVEYRKLSLDNSIFGIICISDSKVYYYDDENNKIEENINAGTIFIDKNVHLFFADSEHSENFTIMHECIHWFIHRKYFLFSKICNNGQSTIACGADGEIKNIRNNKDLQWIERQANQITARVLMPEKTFLTDYYKFFRNSSSELNYEKISESVMELSKNYSVSITATKIRLSELGINELTGIYEFIDDTYVESYFYKQKQNENISFSISRYDFSFLYFINSTFREVLKNGNYIYVDKHLCVNDEKYIIDNIFGKHLTQYARENIYTCCLPFIYEYNIQNNSFEIKDFAFCRKNMSSEKFQIKVNFGDNKDLTKKYNSSYFERSTKEITAELSELPGDFAGALNKIIENREMTNEEIAEKSGLDDRTIRRIRKNNTKAPNIKTILAICIGLRLNSNISYALIRRSNYNIDSISEKNVVYRQIIETMYNYPIEEVNKFLEENNLEKL